jgi:hypothetical protein
MLLAMTLSADHPDVILVGPREPWPEIEEIVEEMRLRLLEGRLFESCPGIAEDP